MVWCEKFLFFYFVVLIQHFRLSSISIERPTLSINTPHSESALADQLGSFEAPALLGLRKAQVGLLSRKAPHGSCFLVISVFLQRVSMTP